MVRAGAVRPVLDGYDYTRPTNVNYAVGRRPLATTQSRYASVRARLDYAYHGYYAAERVRLQDTLVDDVLSGRPAQGRPWIVFSAGAMGAGKTHTIRWMTQQSLFPLRDVVHIDPDHFKEMLPEWAGYCERDPHNAGGMCHRESGLLVEIATEAAMASGMNVWVDGSLRNTEWYVPYFQRLRREYPAYRIAILHVIAPLDLILRRAASRGRTTQRIVPESDILDSYHRVPAAVAALAPYADFVAHIENDGRRGPRLVEWSTHGDALRHEDGSWAAAARGWLKDDPDAKL